MRRSKILANGRYADREKKVTIGGKASGGHFPKTVQGEKSARREVWWFQETISM